jgi:transcription elongation factor Elf1
MTTITKPKQLPTHAKCPFCEHETKLDPYVYAHWNIVLIGTCEGCNEKFKILRGVTYVVPRQRKKS